MTKTNAAEIAVLERFTGQAGLLDTSGNKPTWLALFTAVADEEAGTATELIPSGGGANAPGYQRKDTTGQWGTASGTTGVTNAFQIAMATATADWPAVRYWGLCLSGPTPGVADEWVLDVLTDGTKAVGTVATGASCVVTASGQSTQAGGGFGVGDLVVARVMDGMITPGGLTVGIQVCYKVSAVAGDVLTLTTEAPAAVPISSVGSVHLTRVTPQTVTANHAATFNAGDLSYAEG